MFGKKPKPKKTHTCNTHGELKPDQMYFFNLGDGKTTSRALCGFCMMEFFNDKFSVSTKYD